jgi:hypothetical protein
VEELLRKTFAGEGRCSQLLEKPGDGEAKRSSSGLERSGHDRCAAAILRAPKLDEVRRSGGASSPDC